MTSAHVSNGRCVFTWCPAVQVLQLPFARRLVLWTEVLFPRAATPHSVTTAGKIHTLLCFCSSAVNIVKRRTHDPVFLLTTKEEQVK